MNVPDFNERQLSGMGPMDSCDVYMSTGAAKGSPAFKKSRPNGTLHFTGGGMEFSLVAVPTDSLKRLARFIMETAKDYERTWGDA